MTQQWLNWIQQYSENLPSELNRLQCFHQSQDILPYNPLLFPHIATGVAS